MQWPVAFCNRPSFRLAVVLILLVLVLVVLVLIVLVVLILIVLLILLVIHFYILQIVCTADKPQE